MEFIDAEEIESDDKNSDEESLVMNFQHMSVSEKKVKMKSKKKNVKMSKGKLSMAATEKKKGLKYMDTDILIDTRSTCSVFKNADMVINVKKIKAIMRAMSNGGHQDSRYVGHLPGFFDVWVNEKSLMNILAMCEVQKRFRVTIDMAIEPTIMYTWEERRF